MAFKAKIYLAILLAVVIAIVFFHVNRANQALLSSHAEILHHLYDIEFHNQKIDQEVLRSAFLLYGTYDTINQHIREIRRSIDTIHDRPLLQESNYRGVLDGLDGLRQQIEHKENAFLRFATVNSLIKNSATQIGSLSVRFLQTFPRSDHEYVYRLAQIASSVFLARNALDADLISGIDKSLEEFAGMTSDDPQLKRFHSVFTAHAQVMRDYLPRYVPLYETITQSDFQEQIHQLFVLFEQISTAHAQRLRYLFLFVSAVLVGAVIFVIALLFNLEFSRLQQVELTETLRLRATTDQLTGLPNRFAFEQQAPEILENSAILLVNIDGFQSINDFYSHRVGDECLRFIGRIITEFLTQPGIRGVFRVGSDEYVVLVDSSQSPPLTELAQQIIDKVDRSIFTYDQLSLVIRVSLGISAHAPLLEKADLALRQIKGTRRKYLEYQPELALDDRARKNLTMMNTVREAIGRDLIEPHFMPIMNNRSREIVGYECLIRIRDTQGTVHFPGDFLAVAKQARLYGELTKTMFKKCFDRFAENDYKFSLNLSIEDIEDSEVINYILNLLRERPDIGKRLTLEILESDGIENYARAQSFIEQVKDFGCRIAIDDYGTGYSNLQHLLKLNADILKLDGSFIEPLGKDVYSFVAVRAIVDMARELGITVTTAEFVSDEEIYMIVTSLGITNSQGYFIGRATETLQQTPDCIGILI